VAKKGRCLLRQPSPRLSRQHQPPLHLSFPLLLLNANLINMTSLVTTPPVTPPVTSLVTSLVTSHLDRNTQGALTLDGVSLAGIAQQFGTPTYVYSQRAITENFQSYQRGFEGRDHLICYAMKANSNLSILKLLASLGAGFDIVSSGELLRALAAGADAAKIVFSGVGKTREEITLALQKGVGCFNIESAAELDTLADVAVSLGERAKVSFRVNPDVDPKTHPYISTGLKGNKFGVAFEEALALYRRAAQMSSIHITGIDFHIGSQITEIAPYLEAMDKLLGLVAQLQREGITLEHVDFGGGLGITYNNETLPSIYDFAHIIRGHFDRSGMSIKKILLEPGRSIVGNTGVLLTRAEVIKQGAAKNFCIVDAAMNDYMRPALYQSFVHITEVQASSHAAVLYDVVGPVCESGDWLGHDRELAVQAGDLLALQSAGAYGMSMSSNYNTRNRAAEVMVHEGKARLIRQRETYEQQMANELTYL
jgi:diaminopimelate decarboxylase